MSADRYAKLRTIPDYIEGLARSAYISAQHPYAGQVRAANREYAADLRALLEERDALLTAIEAQARSLSKATSSTPEGE